MVMCNIEFILSEKNLTKIYDYPIENTSLIDFQQEIVDFLMVIFLFILIKIIY